jgi:hypothetical protein
MNNLAQNLITAKRQLRELERKKFAERQSLIDQIEAAFADDLAEANKRVNEARKALQDYAVANAAHPLLGKKVTRTIRELHRFSTVKYTDTQIFGSCEVFTFSMPRRAGYCYHSPGDIVVRVLKKDGTPGLTVEAVKGWSECE